MSYAMLVKRLERLALLGMAPLCMGSTLRSVSPDFGPGVVWQGTEPTTVDSSAVHIPLNFWLESKDGSDLTVYAAQATDDGVRQFLSIGLSAIGKDYGFNGANCTYTIKRPAAQQAQATPRGALSQMLVQYQVDVGIQCVETAALEVSTSTKLMKTLLSIDPESIDPAFSPQLAYKSRFTAEVSAIIYATKPDRVLFDVGTHVQLQRQSKFAPRDQFQAFSQLDQNAIDQVRNDIRVRLVNAYAVALSNIGLSTEAADPNQS
jgi:hypothetical protein